MEVNQQNATANQVFAAAEQMSENELEQLVNRVLALQAERRAPSLAGKEAEFLQKINLSLPEAERKRLRELQNKRDTGELSAEEYEELASLIDNLEEIHAVRMEALAELASIRRISLREIMAQLDIRLPENE